MGRRLLTAPVATILPKRRFLAARKRVFSRPDENRPVFGKASGVFDRFIIGAP